MSLRVSSPTSRLVSCAVLLVVACGGDTPKADTPAPATPAPAPAAPFSLDSIPLSKATLPAFPYIDWPASVPADERKPVAVAANDQRRVIAGAEVRTVTGQFEQRVFTIPAGSSAAEQRAYYRDRIAALGGVVVNRLQPVGASALVTDAVQALVGAGTDAAKALDLQRYDEGDYTYEVSVARTTTTTVWWIVQVSTYSVVVTTIAAPAAP